MCEWCRLVRKKEQAICKCNCRAKISSGKWYYSKERGQFKCMSCGHYNGIPKTTYDYLIALHNLENKRN